MLAPKQRLMFLDFRLNTAERPLAAGQNVWTIPCSSESPCGQRQGQRTGLFLRPRIFGKYPFELDQVRLVALQQPAQLVQAAIDLNRNGLL